MWNKALETLSHVEKGDFTQISLRMRELANSNLLDVTDTLGLTLLMRACSNNSRLYMYALLVSGADIGVLDKKLRNVYHYLYHLIEDSKEDISVQDILDEFTSIDAHVNVQDKFGWTPLMYAVESNNIKVAQFLLEKGANVNKTSEQGATCQIVWYPLKIATRSHPIHQEMLQLLLHFGATE